MAEQRRSWTEEVQVSGEALVAKVRELVHQGNVRRVIVKNEQGRTLIEIPLTLGVIGAVVAPVWAALGAVAALLTESTIIVERVDLPEEPAAEDEEGGEE